MLRSENGTARGAKVLQWCDNETTVLASRKHGSIASMGALEEKRKRGGVVACVIVSIASYSCAVNWLGRNGASAG